MLSCGRLHPPILQRKNSAYLESGPFRVLRGQANGIGSGSKFWMPALEVASGMTVLAILQRWFPTFLPIWVSMANC
jgi:hypothetical protein